jgi:hypothetical protein
MRPELVRIAVAFARAAQQVGVKLDLPAAVRKDQIVRAAQRLVHVIRDIDRAAGHDVFETGVLDIGLEVNARRLLDIALDQNLQFLARAARFDDLHVLRRARPQKFCGETHVAERRRQADARHTARAYALDALHQRLQLHAALGADERVQFVDDDIAQRAERRRQRRAARDEHRFERFGRDQQHACGLLQKALLAARRYIAMPAGDGNLQCFAQIVEPRALIVDQRLQRTDVQHRPAARLVAQQVRKNGEKSGFRLARRRRRRDDHVAVGVDQRGHRAFLRIAQLGPAFAPDPAANALVEQIEAARIS